MPNETENNRVETVEMIEATCTLYNARRAARAITDVFETFLAPSGVRATQFNLLVAIKRHAPLSVSSLAKGLQTDRTTLSRTLKPLLENNWIEITQGNDKRVHEVTLTIAGEAAFQRAVPLWEQAQKHVQEQLGHEPWRELIRHLQAAATVKS